MRHSLYLPWSLLTGSVIRRMLSYKCFLDCVDGSHPPIALPHRTPVVIGRSPDTCIVDKRVSRKQVEITADCVKREARVTQLGSKPSVVHKTELSTGGSATLRSNHILHLLVSCYPHKIIFKLQEKASASPEKKISDFFSGKSDKNKADCESGNLKDNNSMSKVKNESNKLKRHRSDNDDDGSKSKKLRKDVSDSDEDEEVQRVAEKLKLIQESNKNDNKTKNVTNKDLKPSTSRSKPSDDLTTVSEQRGSPQDKADWFEKDTLMVHHSKHLCASSKVAAFDIDGNIICTQSGKVFPTHAGDWRILYPEIPGTLKKLHADGYKIVFITNQMGIQRGKVKIPEFQQKIENIIAKLGVPVHVLVSKGAGPYRKPGLGMWNHLLHNDNDGISIDMRKSLYVGDAAGRPKDWEPKRKKDFSCSDRLFALNAGLRFYTPEEYFQKKSPAPYNLPEFDPRKLSASTPLLVPASASLVSGQLEVIVMAGSPASGKSHFVRGKLLPKGYVHVSRDIHKTWQKCVELCKSSLEKGKSVVIDNTNPDVESRARYTAVAKSKKVPCRCFVMATSIAQAKHNERFREMTDKSHQSINDMILNSFKSKYVEPTTSEGFTEIVKVNIVPDFRDKEHDKLYRMFLMDK